MNSFPRNTNLFKQVELQETPIDISSPTALTVDIERHQEWLHRAVSLLDTSHMVAMRLRKRLVELYSAAISGAGAEGQGQAQGMEPHMLCRHTLALLRVLLDLHEHQSNLHADQHEHCQTWADLSSAIRSLLALQPTCATAEGLLELPHFTDFAEARAFEFACYKVGLMSAVSGLPPAACCLLPAACCLLPAACCLMPAVYCLLPAACCMLPAVCRLTAIFFLRSTTACGTYMSLAAGATCGNPASKKGQRCLNPSLHLNTSV
jgi:hypothetical protein